MRRLLLLFICLLSLTVTACRSVSSDAPQELVLIENGKSAYQIVIPVMNPDPKDLTWRNLEECAALLQECIRESTRVILPVVAEDKADPRKPGIYLGNTKFAQKQGIDLSGLKQWQYLRKTVGDNLILAGLDMRGPIGKERTYYSIGTMKAVTAFLQEQLGVRFLLPGKNGIHVPPQKTVMVPCGELFRKPNLEFNIGVHPTNPYSIANNLYNAPFFNSHGGHSYYDAVPRAKYAKTNPEYFAMADGRRNTAGFHLCISNPEVQELLYQELVRELDRGFEVTELGQTDGYIPCACEKCRALFGVEDPGEKLWILHRSFAERLKKERPGKKVVIISYGPTTKPPKTFRSFPDNVIIELCSYSPESFAEWSRLSVPGGFMAYIYNWGDYQFQGFTAKFGPAMCEEQIMLFVKNKVKGLYRCGFGELFGMEGPLYYAWSRGFDTPGKGTIRPLLEEFYSAAYGNAKAPMKRFFTTLYDRLDYFENAQKYEEKLNSPLLALSMIYTPDVLLTMEKNLERAEQMNGLSDKEKARIHLVWSNFEYTRNLARIVTLYNAFRIAPTAELYKVLEAELAKRAAMIDPILRNKSDARKIKGWPDAGFFAASQYIQRNGRLRATLNAPFTWNLQHFRKAGIIPGESICKKTSVIRSAEPVPMTVELEKGIWSRAEWNTMISGTSDNKTPSRFKLVCDSQALYVGFEGILPGDLMKQYVAAGHDGTAWEQECLELLLDVEGNRERYFHFILNPVQDSYYDAARGYISDPLHPLYNKPDVSWNGHWEYRNFLIPERNRWCAVIRIPFRSLGLAAAPEKGTRWTANFGREHIRYRNAVPELLLWSPSQETASFHDPDSYGELDFE